MDQLPTAKIKQKQDREGKCSLAIETIENEEEEMENRKKCYYDELKKQQNHKP